MRRSRAPSNWPGPFFAARSWAGCTTNMFGFDLRQAHHSGLLVHSRRCPSTPRHWLPGNKVVRPGPGVHGRATFHAGGLAAQPLGSEHLPGSINQLATRAREIDLDFSVHWSFLYRSRQKSTAVLKPSLRFPTHRLRLTEAIYSLSGRRPSDVFEASRLRQSHARFIAPSLCRSVCSKYRALIRVSMICLGNADTSVQSIRP